MCHVLHREVSPHAVVIDDADVPAGSSSARGSNELPNGATFSTDNSLAEDTASEDPPMAMASTSPTSGWRLAIWELLHQRGWNDVDDDEGIIVFVNSYYIDHEHASSRRSFPPSSLRP